MSERRLLPLALVIGTVVLTGCGVGGTATPSSSPATSPASTAALPARPKAISIDTLDPCTVLTTGQQQQLQLDQQPERNGPGQADKNGNRGCTFFKVGSSPRFTYLVTPVPQEGAEVWLKGERNVLVKQVAAAGFGAVETRIGDTATSSCNVVIDVAPGQSLDVQFGLKTVGAMTTDQVCGKAREGAELIMQTLSARS